MKKDLITGTNFLLWYTLEFKLFVICITNGFWVLSNFLQGFRYFRHARWGLIIILNFVFLTCTVLFSFRKFPCKILYNYLRADCNFVINVDKRSSVIDSALFLICDLSAKSLMIPGHCGLLESLMWRFLLILLFLWALLGPREMDNLVYRAETLPSVTSPKWSFSPH